MIKKTAFTLTVLILCVFLFACHPADVEDTTSTEAAANNTDGITTDVNSSPVQTEPETSGEAGQDTTGNSGETDADTAKPVETEADTQKPADTEPESTAKPDETEAYTQKPDETEPDTTNPADTEEACSAQKILDNADEKYDSYTSLIVKHNVSTVSDKGSAAYGTELRKASDSRSFTANPGGNRIFLFYNNGSAYYGNNGGYYQKMTAQAFDAIISDITGEDLWTFTSSSYTVSASGDYTVIQSGTGAKLSEFIGDVIRKSAGLDGSADVIIRQAESRHSIDAKFNRTKRVITIKADVTYGGATLPVTCTVTSTFGDVNSAVSTLSPAATGYTETDSLSTLVKINDAYNRYCNLYKGTGGYKLTENAVIFDGLTKEYSSENTVAYKSDKTSGKYYFSSDIKESTNGVSSSLVSYYNGTRLAYKKNGGAVAYDNTINTEKAMLSIQSLMTDNFGNVFDMTSFSVEKEGGAPVCVFDLNADKYGRNTLLGVYYDFTGENPADGADVAITEFSGRIKLDSDGIITGIGWIISGVIDCGGGLTYDISYTNTVVIANEGSSTVKPL